MFSKDVSDLSKVIVKTFNKAIQKCTSITVFSIDDNNNTNECSFYKTLTDV